MFLWWERRAPDPMLPLALFHRRAFSVGNVYTLVTYAALGLVVFFLTLFLQGVGGYSALEAGLAVAPMSCILLLLASRVGHLASVHGARPFLVVGPLLFGCGALLMMRLGPDPSYVADVLPIPRALRARPVVLRRAADHDGGGRRGVGLRGHRVGRQQRRRPHRRHAATAVVGVLVASVYVTTLDVYAPDAPPGAVAAVDEVRDAPFRMPDTAGLPPEAARQAEQAVVLASEDAIDAVALVAAALLALASIVAGVGLRPRRARAPAARSQPVPD